MLNSIPSSRNSKARNIKKLIKYNDSTFIKRYLGFSGYYSGKELNDIINSKFGRDSITIGSLPKNISDFSGTKVAFTRIPDIKEFYE